MSRFVWKGHFSALDHKTSWEWKLFPCSHLSFASCSAPLSICRFSFQSNTGAACFTLICTSTFSWRAGPNEAGCRDQREWNPAPELQQKHTIPILRTLLFSFLFSIHVCVVTCSAQILSSRIGFILQAGLSKICNNGEVGMKSLLNCPRSTGGWSGVALGEVSIRSWNKSPRVTTSNIKSCRAWRVQIFGRFSVLL